MNDNMLVGRKVAIVGPRGSGKTSLACALTGGSINTTRSMYHTRHGDVELLDVPSHSAGLFAKEVGQCALILETGDNIYRPYYNRDAKILKLKTMSDLDSSFKEGEMLVSTRTNEGIFNIKTEIEKVGSDIHFSCEISSKWCC